MEAQPNFPASHMVPKSETQADAFINSSPDQSYDGRGIIVAIMDTGTDVRTDGLIITTDGKPKIIDAVDASGSGDITMTKRVQVKDGHIIGLSGRSLSIPDSDIWKSQTGEYRVGIKRLFELFPDTLVSRLKTERRRKFDANQRALEAKLHHSISELPSDRTNEVDDERVDRETCLVEIKSLGKGAEDPGPVCDVISWFDGTDWRVCVDTSESGRLSECTVLRSYRIAQEYATFSGDSLMNYSINIHDDGDVLEIVVQAGSHGTHVAGIVAANFPNTPELNGIAPGAQIVSIKVGDSRLGSMETTVGLIRGLLAALKAGASVINLSYGEASSVANSGRFVEAVDELVTKYGIVYVSSAGNSGPALSSAGSPGATSRNIIGVGAFVSAPMMLADYSLRKSLKDTQYTWSSRGPSTDGAFFSISAPGGAITSVPTFTLQSKQLMNGTSMSSPNAAGGIALIMSGMKAKGLPCSPQRVRRAIENTAKDCGLDLATQGCGLLSVVDAFNWLEANASIKHNDCDFRVSTPENGRGIYLREPCDVAQSKEIAVTITPTFYERETYYADSDRLSDQQMSSVQEHNLQKVSFELRVVLECHVPWVECPTHVFLPHGGRSFNVLVHPTKIGKPGAHMTEILGFDSENRELGALFRVPITVIVPEPPQQGEGSTVLGVEYKFTNLFTPGKIARHFVAIPNGATYCDFVIRGRGIDTTRQFMFHSLFLSPEVAFHDNEVSTFLALANDDEKRFSLNVQSGRMLEVTLAQFWNVDGNCTADIEVRFHGISTGVGKLIAGDSNAGFVRFDCISTLRSETLDVKASLDKLHQPVRPSSSVIASLSQRDVWPRNRQSYELILAYQWENTESCKILVRLPMLQNVLYESIYESRMYLIFDSNKRYLGAGDAWPKPIELRKGKYTFKVQVRHDDIAMLEKLKDMTAIVEINLSKGIDLSAYSSLTNFLTGTGKLGDRRVLKVGQRKQVYLALPVDSKAVPAARAGDTLSGSMTVIKQPGVNNKSGAVGLLVTVPLKQVDTKEPIEPSVRRIKTSTVQQPEKLDQELEEHIKPVVPAIIDKDENSTSSVTLEAYTSDVKDPVDSPHSQDIAADLRDLQIKYIGEQKNSKRQAALAQLLPSLEAQWPLHLQLALLVAESKHDAFVNNIRFADSEIPQLNDVLVSCDRVIELVDSVSVAAHFGRVLDKSDSALLKQRKEFEKKRDALVQALTWKLTAIMHSAEKSDRTQTRSVFDDVFREWASFVDVSQKDKRKKHVAILAYRDELRGRRGARLKEINTVINEASAGEISKQVFEQRIVAIQAVVPDNSSMVQHLVEWEHVWNMIRFPVDFMRF